MSKIVITGAAGFLGSHLYKRLKKEEEGANLEVVGVGHQTRSPHLTYYANLNSTHSVNRLYHNLKPDVLIHLAATVGGIGDNAKNPGLYFHNNLRMGFNLIEEGRKYGGLSKFILCGTICSYPKFTPTPFREEDIWNGYPEETNAPYGIAKKALMEMLIAYKKQYDFPGVNLLPVNLYGPGDRSSHVIPDLFEKFWKTKQEGGNVTLFGDGSPTREFLYVSDCCEAFRLVLNKDLSPSPINIGSGFEITIKELAEKIAKLFEFQGELIFDPSKPNGQPKRLLDITRARARLGYTPKVYFDEGLKKMFDWFIQDKLSGTFDTLPKSEQDKIMSDDLVGWSSNNV